MRKGTLPDGQKVWVHMFYADMDGLPQALVEAMDGSLHITLATNITFDIPFGAIRSEMTRRKQG